MFDGACGPPGPRPPRSGSIDARAMLPALRIQGSEAAVEGLAYLLALNALEAARWRAVTWPGEDLLDRDHPAHAAALNVETPQGRMVEALALLADAIARHQALTGRDGMRLARATLINRFNAEFADRVLAPLDAAKLDIAVETLLHTPDPGDPPAPPPREPASSERQKATGALLAFAWTAPWLGGLADALEAFHAAHQADGEGAPGAATRAALASVRVALQCAADRGVGQADLQMLLDTWSTATTEPTIRLDGNAPA